MAEVLSAGTTPTCLECGCGALAARVAADDGLPHGRWYALPLRDWMDAPVGPMVAASFLAEFLGVSWVDGARWFHETLVDADVAINSMMWQNAGRSGIDQWNFVLSPETGSQDPSGAFCRRWLPELARLPSKWIHTPWLAPPDVLASAGVSLGGNYPERILTDLPAARKQTVDALLAMRAAALDKNDANGYDLIMLPSGESTRVFTKQEFRLNAKGEPPAPLRAAAAAVAAIGRRRSVAEAKGGARGVVEANRLDSAPDEAVVVVVR